MRGYVDGNALAGALSELLTPTTDAGTGRCATCGADAVLAEAHVWSSAMGHVARCRGCDDVLAVIVQHDDRVRMRLHGLEGFALVERDAAGSGRDAAAMSAAPGSVEA